MRLSLLTARTAITALVMILFAGTAFAADIAEVQLKPRAEVDGAVITLGEIANVRHPDRRIESQLAGILVGPAPAAGETVRVSFSAVRSHLRDYGVDLSRVRFSGSSVIAVTSSRTKKLVRYAGLSRSTNARSRDALRAESEVAKAIQQYLSRAVPELGLVSVRVRIPAAEIRNVLTAVNTGYNVRGGRAPWDRMQTFQVRFLDREEKLHEILVEGTIEKHPYVLSAKHSIPKGTLIRASDLAWKQVSTVDADDITQSRDAVGLEATRLIRANESIGKNNVRKVPLVRSNEIVTVYSRRTGIRVARQMKARGNAAAGETLTAVSLDGRDRILVRVTGLHEAEVIGTRTRTQNQPQDQTGSIRFIESTRRENGNAPTIQRSPGRTAYRGRDRFSRR